MSAGLTVPEGEAMGSVFARLDILDGEVGFADVELVDGQLQEHGGGTGEGVLAFDLDIVRTGVESLFLQVLGAVDVAESVDALDVCILELDAVFARAKLDFTAL